MYCKACNERGKTWNGDDPKCGFKTGVFNAENWNCATIGRLRLLADENRVYNEEQSCSVIPIPETCDFIVLCWYKNRGRVDSAIVISDSGASPLTIEIAEEVLNTTPNN